MANIDNLNFGVILNDDDFNRKIEEDIEAAKRFNVQLSSLLDAKAKMPQFKVSVRTKEAEDSLEKLNAKFAELEAADWTKVGKKLDVTHQVEQALIQLRNLEEEIEVIQEIRQEKGGDMGLALELKKAQEQADRLIASISALREAEKAVNAPSQFQAHIRSLTEQSMEYKQLVEYMKAEEAAAAEVAKEKAKEEAARQKNTKAIEKERAAMAKGEFKEYIESLTAANPTLKQMSTYYKELEKETAKNANAAKGAAVHQKRLNDQFKVTSRLGREVKNALIGIFSVHEASKLVSSLIRVTGEFELQKTTLAAMLGDLNKAEQIITRIQGLAVESPFQFKELTTYAKQLSAFSVPAQELYDTTKMLADISAGLGVGMDRIVLAYGQTRSAAFLRGQEVRQYTEAGIPILDELAKQFTELEGRAVSTGEVFDKISARLVPFEMVVKVLKEMTSEGGKFYQMQEIQAETLKGKISNLKDAYEVMLNEIGKGQSENLKGAVDWARRLMQNYEEIGRQLAALVVSYGVYKTTLLGLEVVTKTFTAANHGLINSLMNAGKWLVNNPYAAIAAAITAAGYATYQWATYLSDAEKIQKSVADSNKKYNETLASEYSMLNALYAKLELYTEGTLEHDKAKAQLMQKYHPYLEQLRQEGVEVSNLANIYGNLVEKIREKVQSTFYESSMQDLEQTYKDAEDKAKKMLSNSIKANAKEYILSEKDKLALSMYVLGGMSQEKAFEKMTDSAKEYFKEFNVFLDRQRSNMLAARDAYIEGMDDISDAYQSFQEEAAEEPINLTLFAKTVQDTLAGFGATKDNKGKLAGLWADNKTEYYDYLDKLRKGYEEVKQKIKDVGSTQKANLPDLEKQKQAIEAMAKALKISLDKGDYGKGKSQAQIDLEAQIDLVKKLQDAYEKLEPFVDDKTMKSALSKFFPDAKKEWIDSLDFTTVLKTLADELEKYDKDAAERLRNSIGKIGIDAEVENLINLQKGYKESAKAAEQYFNTLRKWASEDFNLNGEGIALDVSKIASDLNAKMNEIELRATKAKEIFSQIDVDSEEEVAKVKEIFVKEFGADAWEDFWDNYYTEGVVAIDRLTAKQKEYEKKLAQEKVNDLAQKYVKESYFEGNIELTDLGDKNVFQLNNLRKRLQDLLNEKPLEVPIGLQTTLLENGVDVSNLVDVDLSEFFDRMDIDGADISDANKELLKLIQQIQKAGLSTEKFGQKIKDVFQKDLKNLTDEEIKALGDFGKMIGDQILSIASALEELGKESGNGQLEALGRQISELGDVVNSVAQGFQAGGWVGGLIAGIGSLATKVIESIAEAEAATQRAAEKAIEYAATLQGIKFDNLMKSHETIFGSDDYGKMIDAAKEAAKYQEQALKATEAIGVSMDEKGSYLLNESAWAIFNKGAREAKDLVLGLNLGDILIDGRNAWQKFWGTGTDLIKTFNINDFIDAEGNLMGEELRNVLTQYGDDMSSETRDALNKTLNKWDLYVKALEKVTSYLTDMFGQVADHMTDSFVESFKKTGEAALETESIMDAVATNIAKSVVKSMLINEVFKEDDIEKISKLMTSGDTANALEETAKLMEKAQGLAPAIQEYLGSVSEYFKMENESMQSLGDGIKGITEDTANLLASYLNAIRADVSYARTIWERMDVTTQQIAVLLSGFSAPSLMEYQMQIAANTYNTAMNTQSIMEDLRSVITSTDGPTGIRVYS